MVSKNANINGPKTILGAQILFFMYLVTSLTNEECTLAKSSKRNNTVLSASNSSFFSFTSKNTKIHRSLTTKNQYIK